MTIPQANQLHPKHQLHQYRAMVKNRYQDAMGTFICIFGMAASDQDDPCYDMFLLRPLFGVRQARGVRLLRFKNSARAGGFAMSLRWPFA